MKATEVLKSEHRVIEQVLSCLLAAANKLERDHEIDADTFRQAIEFFRLFADRCHHAKEEGALFPLLTERGLPEEGGPVGVMLYEHEEGRRHVRTMDEALPAAEKGERFARTRLVEHAREYAALLQEHIRKEDDCLFDMAERMLTSEDQAFLSREFDRAEEERDRATHTRLVATANELAKRWNLSTRATGNGPGCCCHGA